MIDTIQELLEELIDDIERDNTITNADILSTLYKLKTEIEDYNLSKEERNTIDWEDLD